MEPAADTQGDIDVPNLSQEKIKQMMKSDPKFIGRLINQLDKQMHSMMMQKLRKNEEITADQAEVDKIDAMIKSHIQPNLDRLAESIKQKTELRDHVAKQLAEQTMNLKQMERDAATLISSIRTRTSKLMKTTASQRLEEVRGFSSSIPTSTLVRGTTTKPKAPSK